MTYKLVRYSPRLGGESLRGRNYVFIRDSVIDTLMYLFVDCVKRDNGAFRVKNIAYLAGAVGLPLKTTCEYLEQMERLPSGTWERIFGRPAQAYELSALLLDNYTFEKQMDNIAFEVVSSFQRDEVESVSWIFEATAIPYFVEEMPGNHFKFAVSRSLIELARRQVKIGLELIEEGVL